MPLENKTLSNPLENIIVSKILTEGPLPLSEYMSLCLYHPLHGFYMKESPLGKDGAFITSPEISQLFGEMVGLWAVQSWYKLGQPADISLIELGPGRGTLMKDLLRATRHVPDFHQNVQIHLVEISPYLRQKQASIPFSRISWHGSMDSALAASGDRSVLLIANEFFDALPFTQYLNINEAVNERRVGGGAQLEFMDMPLSSHPQLKERIPKGGFLELSPLSDHIISILASHIKKNRGAALIIDYGYAENSHKDTFQALYKHAYSNPLENIGASDLTFHVNFAALLDRIKEKGISSFSLVTQKRFLETMGIHLRGEILKKKASLEQAKAIDLALKRLTRDMGSLYKVLSFYY